MVEMRNPAFDRWVLTNQPGTLKLRGDGPCPPARIYFPTSDKTYPVGQNITRGVLYDSLMHDVRTAQDLRFYAAVEDTLWQGAFLIAGGVIQAGLFPPRPMPGPGGGLPGRPLPGIVTGSEWYQHFATRYGAANVEWTSGSGRTLAWPRELPLPTNTQMFRVRPPKRSSTFITELESVAGEMSARRHRTSQPTLGIKRRG